MSIRVIIVDDEKDLRDVLAEFLEIHDIKVVGTAESAGDGVKLFMAKKPDVVLLDLHLAESSGFVALQKIRKINRDAKVIMVTGDSHTDVSEDSMLLGALAIVHKTEELNELPELIKKSCKSGFSLSLNLFGKKKKVEI